MFAVSLVDQSLVHLLLHEIWALYTPFCHFFALLYWFGAFDCFKRFTLRFMRHVHYSLSLAIVILLSWFVPRRCRLYKLMLSWGSICFVNLGTLLLLKQVLKLGIIQFSRGSYLFYWGIIFVVVFLIQIRSWLLHTVRIIFRTEFWFTTNSFLDEIKLVVRRVSCLVVVTRHEVLLLTLVQWSGSCLGLHLLHLLDGLIVKSIIASRVWSISALDVLVSV